MICCCSPGRLTLLPLQFIRVRHLADNQINPERNNKFYRISSVCGFALETYIYLYMCAYGMAIIICVFRHSHASLVASL